MIYTHTEKNVKRHDVNFVVKQARAVLKDKKINDLCVNNVPDDYGQLYTTEQASDIIDTIIDDSIFYRR